MHYPRRSLATLVLLLFPVLAHAQRPPVAISDVRVGFKGYEPNRTYSKAGMWAPVHVDLQVGADKIDDARLILETNDNEDTPTITSLPILLNANQDRTLSSFILPGNMNSDVRVKIKSRDKSYQKEKDVSYLDLSRIEPSMQLYLTVGGRFNDLHKALQQIRIQELAAGPKAKDNLPPPAKKGADELEPGDTSPRFLAFETDAKALPDQYHGYQAIDLIILSTADGDFVRALSNDEIRLRALSEWLRRGGHMVVSVHWQNQADVARLLASAAWQPPVPVKLPRAGDRARAPKRLVSVEQWAQVNNKPFEKVLKEAGERDRIPIALLQDPAAPPTDWEVQAAENLERDGDVVPTMTRVPYGLGSITFLAFSVDPGSPFSKWDGRFEFWKRLIRRLTPRFPQADGGQQFAAPGHDAAQDLITKLHGSLDTWDVTVVPFGWVALFILIYIVIVGPVDYLVLKYVFKRLEWTWFTFPIVVCAVSLAAYFSAVAVKGNDLRINQVDVVDIDMRTELNDRQPARAYVYGQTFFALLSPRLRNYTIGVEVNPRFWGQNLDRPLSADMVSWLGKGGTGWGGAENRGSAMYFRRPYYINDPSDQAVGLVGVPIASWASKSFTATWGAVLPELPLSVDLRYRQENIESETVLKGTLGNNLPVDLEDVWLCYNDQIYGVTDLLPGHKAAPLKIELPLPQKQKTRKPHSWAVLDDLCDADRRTGAVDYNPTPLIKEAFVFDRSAESSSEYDQWLRRLDVTWRMQEEVRRERDTRLREAILYARVRFRTGPAQELCGDVHKPLPTHIWLGNLPGHQPARTQPTPAGILNQDTYLRVLLPVRPARP